MTGDARLKQAIARLRSRRPKTLPPFSPEPSNAFQVAIAERLTALTDEVDRLRSRLNWLLTIIIGAALANTVIALIK